MGRTNRELVMLAQTFDAAKHRVGGMYLSEKLDGMRCLYLPATKGLEVGAIPFANTAKDDRRHIASGLWTRYGKVIHCPPTFTEGWPNYPLDGELYAGRGGFQKLMSITKKLKPDEVDWQEVAYNVFDAPKYQQIFADGRINGVNYKKQIVKIDCYDALGLDPTKDHQSYIFDATYKLLKKNLPVTDTLVLHQQELLPFITDEALAIVNRRLDEVTNLDGEGLILRHPASVWEPIRTTMLMKVKKLQDAEATVVDHRTGQGKFLGMLGSLTVRFGGTVFELSGFTDQERYLDPAWVDWARYNPDRLCSTVKLLEHPSPTFKIGDIIQFYYRELSDSGVPKEARFKRKL